MFCDRIFIGLLYIFFFFQAEDGIRDDLVTGVQTCALPICDIFHVIWKANRRNYRLLIREKEQPGAGTGRDWIFLGILLLAVVTAAAIPIALLVFVLSSQGTDPLPRLRMRPQLTGANFDGQRLLYLS